MADEVGTLKIRLEFDSKPLSEANGSKLGQSFGSAWSVAAGNLIAGGLAKIASAAVSVGKDILTTGMNYEKAMSEVKAISGATAAELEILSQKGIQSASTSVFTTSQVAEAYKYMGMAGWDAGQMIQGLDGILDLAAASNLDLGRTSDIVTDALTAFGYAASDSAHFADVLATASTNANTNVDLMGESFKYAGAIAGTLHYSIEDVGVALGVMANSGIKASQAGTSLRGMLTRMSNATGAAKKAMDELGLSMFDAQGNARPLSDVMVDLRQRFAGMTDEQKAQYATTIAGKNAMSGFLAVVNASEADFNKMTTALANADGAAKRMADTMKEGLAGAIAMAKSSWNSAITSLYEGNFDDFFKYSEQAVEGIVNIMEKAAPAIGKGIAALSKLVIREAPRLAGGVVKAIGTILVEVGKELPSIVGEVFGSGNILGPVAAVLGVVFGSKLLGLLNPVNLIGGALKTLSGAITGALSSVLHGIGTAIGKLFEPLGNVNVLKGAASAALIAAGVLVMAKGLQEVMKIDFNLGNLLAFAACVVAAGGIMAVIGQFAVYAAIGSIATVVISGGLLVAAIALNEAGKHAATIDAGVLLKLAGVVTTASVILALISGFATLGAVGAIATSVISGGLLVAAIALNEASNRAKGIDEGALDRLNNAIIKTDTILALISGFAVFGAIGAIITDVIAGGVKVAAEQLVEATKFAQQLNDSDLDTLEHILQKMASWDTGGLLNNIKNMFSSGALQEVANHVVEIVKKFAEMPSIPSLDTIDNLKEAIYRLSQIQIEGGGLFDGRGAAAAQLETIVGYAVSINHRLSELVEVNYGLVDNFVAAINKFEFISDGARQGLLRLNNMKDSFGNLNWFKFILGDLNVSPTPAELFVTAINKFAGIQEAARAGVARLSQMRGGISNIDWIKHILGDIKEEIVTNATNFVTAINKFTGIQTEGEKLSGIANAFNQLKTSITNAIKDLPQLLQEAATSATDSFLNGIINKQNDTFLQGQALANKFNEGLNSIPLVLFQTGQAAQGRYWAGIQGKMRDEYLQGKAMANQFKDGLNAVSMYSAGEHAVQGFINGVNSKDVYSVGYQIAQRFLAGLKAGGREGSPWKTTFASGVFAGEGLVEGIKSTESLVAKAGESLAEKAHLSITPSVSTVGGWTGELGSVLGEYEYDGEVSLGDGVNIEKQVFNISNELDADDIGRRIMTSIRREA